MQDYRAESELGALCRDLLADLERLRPGLPSAPEEAQASVRARLSLRLRELYMDQFAAVAEQDAAGQLALYEREIEQILLPRYMELALRQNQIERAKAIRGDLFNRLAWGTMLFALGLFVVWAPFIPIWEKWVPFALSALAVAFTPALPDLYGRLQARRHQILLLGLLIDLDQAGRALPAAPSLSLPAAEPAVPDPGKEPPS